MVMEEILQVPSPDEIESFLDIKGEVFYSGFPGDAVVKNLPANVGGTGHTFSIPGSGRSPGKGNGHTLQYSCLGNPTDRGVWRATVHGVRESEATEQASVGYFPFFLAHSSSSKSTKPLTELFRNSPNLFFQFPFFAVF